MLTLPPFAELESLVFPSRSRHAPLRALIAAALASLAVQASHAAPLSVDAGATHTEDITVENAQEGLINAGTVQNESITINGGSFKNTGTIETGRLDVFIDKNTNVDIGGSISADEFIYRGFTEQSTIQSQTVDAILDVGKLSIVGTETYRSGLEFHSSESLAAVDSIYVESNGQKVGLYMRQTGEEGVRYENSVELNSAGLTEEARIEVANDKSTTGDAYFYVGEVISNSRIENGKGSKSKLQTTHSRDGDITFEIGRISVETGYLNLQTSGDAIYEGTFILHDVVLGKDTRLRASVYETSGGTSSTPAMRIEGDMTFHLGEGAAVDFGGWGEPDNNDWLPDLITLAADSITINVEDSSSGNLFIVTKNNRETKASDIRVVAAAANNTGDAAADLEKLVDVVQTNYKDEQKKNHLECLPDVQLEQAANDIFDGAVGVVGAGTIDPDTGDCINCGVKDIRTIDNPNVHGIAEMTALGLHIWRNEIDDMHRRMGDLRDSSGQANGLWTRIYNGKASFGGQSIENKYTAFQFGYDHQVSPGLWLGGALSYTYGDNDFDHGEGDSNLLAFTAYASRLFENGFYLDFTGKVGRMKNSFDIRVGDIRSSGDYHTNAVSVSAEAGWRFDVMKNVFFEPQVEVWYGHVFDAQYETSTGVDVDQASTDSLVGRAGFRLGLECPNNRGSAFIKASVLHDWEGEADFRFSKGGVASRTLTEDLGGTWYEYGIGADFNATEQLHFWAELERGDGGEVDTDYRATIGMRYAW